MIRLLNALNLVEGKGKVYQSKEISENLKWGMIPTGQKELGTQVFVEHMRHLSDLMLANPDIMSKNDKIREKGTLAEIIYDADRMSETTHRIAVRRIIMTASIRIQEIAGTGKKGLELDAEIAKTIFAFLNNSELKEHLDAIRSEPKLPPATKLVLNDDILPRGDERIGFLWSYNDRKKEVAQPGKRESILEFTGKLVKKSLIS